MIKQKNGRGKSKKRAIDPVKLAQLRQKRGARSLLERIGFLRVPSDGIEFTFNGRTGELDDIFLQDNILLLIEYTVGKSGSSHIASKSILYEKILAASSGWIEHYGGINSQFLDAVLSVGYQPAEFQVKVIYISVHGVSPEISSAYDNYRFLDGTQYRYFNALSKTIQKSCRYEFYNYLGIEYSKIAQRVHSTAVSSTSFHGHLLPEAHSGYPKGFKVVSFYADAETLLSVAYVLRKDGWRDSDALYQRILIKSKIAKMRRYLGEVGRVFVNNIIVTLPPETHLNNPNDGTNMDRAQLAIATPVNVSVPISANMIGLVDGQHRVFSYYENTLKDPLEKIISNQRKRQNLLVTGLKFPADWNDRQKREFEARLFLEINDNQAKDKSDLKHSIEVILNPFSNTAIAKEVTTRLSRTGSLKGLLQTNFFDPVDRIKTTSIVTYGLIPLIKTSPTATDSLFSIWTDSEKEKLGSARGQDKDLMSVRDRYVDFCAAEINRFLSAARSNFGVDRWKIDLTQKRQILSPTTLNGCFVCMRRLIENGQLAVDFQKKLAGLDTFAFLDYKSSAWRSLGDTLFSRHFS